MTYSYFLLFTIREIKNFNDVSKVHEIFYMSTKINIRFYNESDDKELPSQ